MARKALKDVWLEELEVDEVSVVDAAANRRKFIIVKRADGQAPTESDAPAGDPPAEGSPPAAVPPASEAPPADPAPTPVEKKGAKMAKERLARFKTAVETLNSLVAEIEPALIEAAEAAEALENAGVQKGAQTEGERVAVAKVAELEAKTASLEGQVVSLTAAKTALEQTVGKQKEVIAKARFDAVGNSTPVESEGDRDKPQKVSFGLDFNEERKKRPVAAG